MDISAFTARQRADGVNKRTTSHANSRNKDTGNDGGLDMASVTSATSGVHSESGRHSRGGAGRISPAGSESSNREKYVEGSKALFLRAYEYVRPSCLFRGIIYIFGNRKLFIIYWLNFVATVIIWLHFALIKYEDTKGEVEKGDDYYWVKVLSPSIQFGSAHATLFQMALIPLTMSRFSIAAFSGSIVDKLIPLNRAHQVHNYLGYQMVGIVILSSFLFSGVSGFFCWKGQQEFCSQLSSPLAVCFYLFVGAMVAIGTTSFFRHDIPYEVFYTVHCIAFVFYAIVVAGTVDLVQRTSITNVSHTFIWFSATLLVFICDKFAMRLNHCYRARVVSASAVIGVDSSRMLLVKIRRPILFTFKPGQSVLLRMPMIDQHWHPFSIASNPSSPLLEFYIAVFSPDSWTGKLWDNLKAEADGPLRDRSLACDMMGPIGTGLGEIEEHSHGLLIGTGTGIIPILSMFKQHVRHIIRSSPEDHFSTVEENKKVRLEYELAMDDRKGSFATVWSGMCKSNAEPFALGKGEADMTADGPGKNKSGPRTRKSKTAMKRSALQSKLAIYGTVLLCLITVFGVLMAGMTISWNSRPSDMLPGMVDVLSYGTVVFQISFGIPALFIWDGNNFFSFLDFVLCLVAFPVNLRWFEEYETVGSLPLTEVCSYLMLVGYMIARVWWKSVVPTGTPWRKYLGEEYDGPATERVEVVWITSSASLVSAIFPDINEVWDEVVNEWGLENAFEVCRFSVYCTDTDENAVIHLRAELSATSLYQQGMVGFGRPDLSELIENHSLEVVNESRISSTLLVFCGNAKLAGTLQQLIILNDMRSAVTGNSKHYMEFVSEVHGGSKVSNDPCCGFPEEESDHTPAPTRKISRFASLKHDPKDPQGLTLILAQSWSQAV